MNAPRIGINEEVETGFQLMGGQVDDEEYLRVSEIAEKGVRDRAEKRGGK